MDVIKVEKRNGKAKATQLRRSGLVPCCVYGGDLAESISIQMDQQAANQLFRTKREGSKVSLELNGRVIPTQIKGDSVVLRINDKKRALIPNAE